MADERKVVWVLGAGFSRALGGPLLQTLLTPSSESDIKVRYPDAATYPALHGVEAGYVRNLYRHGLGEEYAVNGRPWRGESMWSNAEEFIDYLDTAAEPRAEGLSNPHAARLDGIVRHAWRVNVPVDGLRNTARHLIAAECSAFLQDVDPRRENWKPFRKWERSLTKHDTIITFNYDLVLERLRDARNEDASRTHGDNGSKLFVVKPGQVDDPGKWSGCTPVLKLHGSVDWCKQTLNKGQPNERVFVEVKDPLFALRCKPEELAIATPGPSKAREAKGFKALWDLATSALAEADEVVFIGYRFPETDADAREALLGAIGDGPKEARGRIVGFNVILGRPGADTERMEALLGFVTGRRLGDSCEVHVYPLWAQDYFSVATAR
jgi:hypothetical protein